MKRRTARVTVWGALFGLWVAFVGWLIATASVSAVQPIAAAASAIASRAAP